MTIYEVSPRGLSCVAHGFFTRHGGVSSIPFHSLNCSMMVGDTKENVVENRRRALSALGLAHRKLFIPNITHGVEAIIVDQHSDEETIAHTDADALITVDPAIVLGITYSDCVPVLVASTDGRLVAAIHAGWRGIAQEVIIKTIQKIRGILGVHADLVAAVGPALSQPGFFVRRDVFDFFARTWHQFTISHNEGGLVDLSGIAIKQLNHAKIDLIEKVGGFTDVDSSRYFSHRRDRGACGRHLAIIGSW